MSVSFKFIIGMWGRVCCECGLGVIGDKVRECIVFTVIGDIVRSKSAGLVESCR